MDSLDILLGTLDELTDSELKTFQLYLIQGSLEGFKRIPKGKLENCDRTDTADIMRSIHGNDGALRATLLILQKMRRPHGLLNMPSPTTLETIGGDGGSSFDFTGVCNGATLRKIGVAVGGWQIKAVRVELSDGRVATFGNSHTFQEFTFEPGERLTKLSLWGNGERTRLGAIKFWTSTGREFFAYMTDWGLKAEYSIDVGSGVCLGVVGRAGADIDSMGFLFINAIQSSVLTNMSYPTLARYKPQVETEYIKSVSYNNDTTADQEHTCEYSRTMTKSTTWSTTTKIESTVSMSVSAGLLDLVEDSGGFALTVGAQQSNSVTYEESITESDSVKVRVPAGKKVSVEVSVGRAAIDLEYSATVIISCKNGSELVFPSTGKYNGVVYTAVNVKTTESTL